MARGTDYLGVRGGGLGEDACEWIQNITTGFSSNVDLDMGFGV